MPESAERSLYSIHHELMNRIAVLSTYSHLLREEELDEDLSEIVAEMIGATQQAHSLCQELAETMDLRAPDFIVSSEQREVG